MSSTINRHHSLQRPPLALVATLLAVAAALTACSGEDEHALGTSVEIDFYDQAEASGSGTVAVTAAREGATTDLEDAGFTLDPDEKSSAAYYVDVEFVNESDATVELHSPGAEDPDGNLISALILMDFGGGTDFAPCPPLPKELAAGETVEGCTIILVPEGRELERISYHPGAAADFIYWQTD